MGIWDQRPYNEVPMNPRARAKIWIEQWINNRQDPLPVGVRWPSSLARNPVGVACSVAQVARERNITRLGGRRYVWVAGGFKGLRRPKANVALSPTPDLAALATASLRSLRTARQW